YILMAAGGSGNAELVALSVDGPTMTTRNESRAGSVAVAAGSTSASQGVDTEQQAARGQSAYRRGRGDCHRAQLEGGTFARALGGDAFSERWRSKNVGDLFQVLKMTMPEDRPGSLEAGAYADIVAYLLKMNGYGAGATELSFDPDALKQISLKQ